MQMNDEMVRVALAAYNKVLDDLSARPDRAISLDDIREVGLRAALTAALAAMWRPIEELTRENDHQRILVAGWQNPTKRVAGYWWWHEDSVVEGAPFEHPQATFWCLAHFSLPSPPKKEA